MFTRICAVNLHLYYGTVKQLLFCSPSALAAVLRALVGCTLLASEAKALFAAGVPACWDRESFYQRLFSYVASDGTLF